MTIKEEKIYESALALFTSKGFHGASTSSIAENAEVSNGTLFHYFRSKDILIQQLHSHIKSEQIAAISAGLDKETNPKEQLKLIWTQSIQWAMTNKTKWIFLHQYKNSPYRKKPKSDVTDFEKLFCVIIEKGIQQKLFRYLPDNFITNMTIGSVYGMTEYLDANPIKFRTPEFMRQAFDVFYDGIKP